MSLSLSHVKSALSIEHAHKDDYINGCIAAVEARLGQYLCRDLSVDFPDGWPADLTFAGERLVVILMRSDGEATAEFEMPNYIKQFLAPFRVYE